MTAAGDRPNVARRLKDTVSIGVQAMVERTVPWWPLAWIERAQRRRLRTIIHHAYATVPFYRTAMDARGLRPSDFQCVTDLEKLPLIDGDTVRRQGELFVSTAIDRGAMETRHGTSSMLGIQKVLYWERSALMRRLAYHERDRPVLNHLVGRAWGQRQLYVLPDLSSSIKQRRLWDRRLALPSGLAQRQMVSAERPFEEIVSAINDLRPHVIYSYGSYADVFARLLIDRRQTIPAPRVWMYGGDMLPADGRRLLEEHVGCRVYTTYQANETGRIGFQCERCEGFHLNIDLCAPRVADDTGRTLAPGEPGEIIVSNLYNRAMVLLNYRLEDRGTLATEPCPCGRTLPVLAALDGRLSDRVYRADGHAMSGFVVDVAVNARHLALATQLIDRGPGRVEFLVVPMSGVDRSVLRLRYIEKVRALMGSDMRVDVTFVDTLPPTAHGKRLKVRRIVTADRPVVTASTKTDQNG